MVKSNANPKSRCLAKIIWGKGTLDNQFCHQILQFLLIAILVIGCPSVMRASSMVLPSPSLISRKSKRKKKGIYSIKWKTNIRRNKQISCPLQLVKLCNQPRIQIQRRSCFKRLTKRTLMIW
jgi:hypothetical protein